jgi:hypothetical protein
MAPKRNRKRVNEGMKQWRRKRKIEKAIEDGSSVSESDFSDNSGYSPGDDSSENEDERPNRIEMYERVEKDGGQSDESVEQGAGGGDEDEVITSEDGEGEGEGEDGEGVGDNEVGGNGDLIVQADAEEGNGGIEGADVSSDESEFESDEEEGNIPLRKFAMLYAANRHHLTKEITRELLAIFRMLDPRFPRDPSTLELPRLPGEVRVKQMPVMLAHIPATSAGLNRYAHFGLRRVLTHALRGLKLADMRNSLGAVVDSAEIWLSIDGVSKFKNSEYSGEFWPLVINIGNIDGLENEMFVVGIYYGTRNPNAFADELVEDFVQEYTELQNVPLRLHNNETVGVRLHRVVADAPCRAMLKGVKGHMSCASCERCEVYVKKLHGSGIMAMPAKLSTAVPLRTDFSFRTLSQKEHYKDENQLNCIFSDFPDLDLVFLFVLDPMHMVYLGVVHRWLKYVMDIVKHQKPPVTIPSAQLNVLSQTYASWRHIAPSDFARAPRLIRHALWKATEWRQFALYTGVPLLMSNPKVDIRITANLQFLMCGLRILSDPRLVSDEGNIDTAERCLHGFVSQSFNILGPEFVVFNVHSLLHLAEEVRRHRVPLERFSAFPSENFFRKLMKYIRAAFLPLKQLENCVEQMMAWSEQSNPRGALKIRALNKEPKLLAEYQEPALKGRFRECQTKHHMFKLAREGDRYCSVEHDGQTKYIQLHSFCTVQEVNGPVQYCEGKELIIDRVKEVFKTPMKASMLGIVRNVGIGVEMRRWHIAEIDRKFYRLPLPGKSHVLIPLIHSGFRC